VEDKELVSISLNGLVVSWRPFVQGVCACEKLPNFTKLWDDLVQEEIGLDSCSVKQEEVEEVALVGRTKKRSKKGYSKAKKEGSNSGKKDLSKLKCFRCH